MIKIIAFDGDDTLWHNEEGYLNAAKRFEELMAQQYGLLNVDGEIYKTERNNLERFGYGVKSYTISMVETAVRLTEGAIMGQHVAEIIQYGKDILSQEIRLVDGAQDMLSQLGSKYSLSLITKGDQFEQESKINRSGLAGFFDHVDIVSQKNPETYSHLLDKYGCPPAEFWMVGNALRSDIMPVVKIGGTAVYVPHELTWEHENQLEEPPDGEHFIQIERLADLAAVIDSAS